MKKSQECKHHFESVIIKYDKWSEGSYIFCKNCGKWDRIR